MKRQDSLGHPRPLPSARRRLKRGLLVALDGLGIGVLAVLVASYVWGGTAISRGPAPAVAWRETIRGWFATPGLGLMEAIAYFGLAVAIGGLLWYGVALPSLDLGRRLLDRPNRRTASGFEFDRARPRADRASGRRGHRTGQSRLASPSDWAESVFDGSSPTGRNPTDRALAQGDFLRSSAGSLSVTVREAAGTGRGVDDDLSSGAVARGSRSQSQPEDSDRGLATTAPGFAVPPDDGSEALEPDGGTTSDAPVTDPLDRLVTSIAEARGTVEAVVDSLREADGDRAGPAAATVSTITATADARVRRLRHDLPSDGTLPRDAIASVHESSGRIEAAFDTVREDG